MLLAGKNNITLRTWEREDALSIAPLANNKAVARYLRDAFPQPYTLDDAVSYIEQQLEHDPPLGFAIAVDDKAVGSIALMPQQDVFRENAEIGYWLAEAYWGKGIITWAIQHVTDHGFKTLNYHRIHAGVLGANKASGRALEKAGYRHEATFKEAVLKDGIRMDDDWYALLRSEWEALTSQGR